jgi:bacteriorhodopsin
MLEHACGEDLYRWRWFAVSADFARMADVQQMLAAPT